LGFAKWPAVSSRPVKIRVKLSISAICLVTSALYMVGGFLPNPQKNCPEYCYNKFPVITKIETFKWLATLNHYDFSIKKTPKANFRSIHECDHIP
jgi:hypothetical protein